MKLWEKIFISLSIIIILIIIGIYAKRTIYYYKLENQKTSTLVSTLKSNIVSTEDGLYMQNENLYYYKGMEVDNYLNYNGILYRIIKIEEEKLKLITESSLTTIAWGSNDNYDESYIKEYLKEYNLGSNILDLEDYKNAGGNSSYLNNNTNYWITNDNKKQYISYLGSIEEDNNISSYGIRPVIYINGDITLFEGAGTKSNPYIITKTDAKVYLGEYIKINDYLFRINKIEEDKYYLILDNIIEKEFTNINDIYNYLNNDYYNLINNSNLIECAYNNGNYGSLTNYDYKNIKTEVVNKYVGLPNIGDLFINDYSDYLLMTNYDNNSNLYYEINNNSIMANTIDNIKNIRPMICINKEITLNGTGSKLDPYVVGE